MATLQNQQLRITYTILEQKNGTRLKVEIRAYSKLDVRKEELLSNNINKQRFINFLPERFKLFGVKTVHANDYADLCYVSVM